MKFVGFKEIPLKSIVIDAVDIRRRMERQHVKDLADDAEANGGEYIHPPTVREDTKALIAGRDRVAGAMVKKRKKIWVHLVECSDDEAKALELAENIYRRALDKDERAKAISALVKLREQQYRAEDEAREAAGEEVSKAPQSTPLARARRDVAKSAGVAVETVRSHEHRVSSASEPVAVQQAPSQRVSDGEVELPAGFQAFGLDVPQAERDRIVAAIDWMADLEGSARHVLRSLAELEKHGGGKISPASIQAIRERAQALGHAIREAAPAGLCFYCKGRPDLVGNCNGCGGTGVVGRHAGDSVPKELKSISPVFVAIDGEFIAIGGAPVQREKSKGKKIRVEVVGEDGASRELVIEPDPVPAGDEEIPF